MRPSASFQTTGFKPHHQSLFLIQIFFFIEILINFMTAKGRIKIFDKLFKLTNLSLVVNYLSWSFSRKYFVGDFKYFLYFFTISQYHILFTRKLNILWDKTSWSHSNDKVSKGAEIDGNEMEKCPNLQCRVSLKI